jgi:hypothetical protein
MRVLFLDFDGVLCRVDADAATATQLPFEWLPTLVSLLAPWPDVLIAVHSTWRYDHTLAELRELLGPLGGRFIGAVPRGPRAQAISWFLHANPAITGSLVLDDAHAEFPDDFPGELVLCAPSTGISDQRVRAAVAAWLENSAPGSLPETY